MQFQTPSLAALRDRLRQLGAVLEQAEYPPVDVELGRGAPRLVRQVQRQRILVHLFDTKRNAFALGIDSKNRSFDIVSFLVAANGVFTRRVPRDIGHVHQAVDSLVDADKKAKIGDILNFSFNGRSDRIFFTDHIPGIGNDLFHAQGNPAAIGFDIQHHSFHCFTDGNNLRRMPNLTRP